MELLIYTDPSGLDVGYLDGFNLDLENGREDDFELKISLNRFDVLSAGCLIYCENQPQLGGRIESFRPNTASKTVTFEGSTWRGILRKKILQNNVSVAPGSTLSQVVQSVLEMAELTELFTPADNLSTVGTVPTTGQYMTPLAALESILGAVGCRPSFSFDPTIKRIRIGSEAVKDYSGQEYDSENINMELSVNKMPVNHIIAVSKSGTAHHLYLQHDGTYADTQEIKGAAEVTKLINVSSDDNEKIMQEMIKAMDAEKKASATSALSVSEIAAEIGDIVGSYEQHSKTLVAAKVTSKVLKMTDKTFQINFETGEI